MDNVDFTPYFYIKKNYKLNVNKVPVNLFSLGPTFRDINTLDHQTNLQNPFFNCKSDTIKVLYITTSQNTSMKVFSKMKTSVDFLSDIFVSNH